MHQQKPQSSNIMNESSLAEMFFPLKEINYVNLTEYTASQTFEHELSIYLKATIESHDFFMS